MLHVRLRMQILLTLFMVTTIGCGDSGPARYEIQGKVTFAGKPVPYGEIVFKPDSEKNNPGPGAVGTIKNGEYRIAAEQGVIAGPHIVLISGFDGEVPAGAPTDTVEENAVKPLFENYKTEVDLKAEVGTQDFAISAE